MSQPKPQGDTLVTRAQNGDKRAFEALYRREAERIYALCLRMVANRTLAEELTQQTFVRAWERIASFEGRSRFSTWLHRLAVNVVLGDRRSRSRRVVQLHQPDAATEPRVPAPRPVDSLALERAIATLPPKARQVFVMHDVEGYKHAEIAQLTGVTVGTSKGQLHRARRLLREALR